MATRYVWGKYAMSVSSQRISSVTYYNRTWVLDSMYVTWASGSPKVAGVEGNPSITVQNGKLSFSPRSILSSGQLLTNVSQADVDDGTLFKVYLAANDSGANEYDYIFEYDFIPTIVSRDPDYTSLLKGIYGANAGKWYITTTVSSLASGYPIATVYQPIKGGQTGTSTNSSASAYPTNGGSGSSWYVYQGSDSIDATAVGYSNQSPMGGQPITINVTPTTPTYGGTIQYTYQVQLSGGSWTTIATKTTATSQQYTIPAGTTSFAARVVANDTWGFSSSTYTTGSTLTVTNNLPPTAPGSISIGSVVGGQQCTITWTAATDPDGTVASYQLERQTDNGDTWTQIYSGSNLTYTDTINADWATVNYRVKATDDDGDSGPYATGTMQTVNDGWLYFSGPPSDMGEQPAPFNFVFSIGSTGATSASSIAVTVIYDDETIYTGTVTSAQQITLPIDTRLTYAGDHDIIVTATANGFLAVTQQCDFTVPSVTLPNGGAAGIMEDDAGKPYYPATLARFVIGLKGLDANALFDRVYTGTYTGTGTSGSGNPCSVRTSFEPILVFIQAAAASTATSGYWVNSAPGQSSQGNMIVNNNGTVTLCPVTWDAEAMTLSWYGTSAAAQLNASGTVYGIIALGGMA